MNPFFAVVFAAVYGVLLRIVFGFLGDIMGIMGLSFLVLAPLIIGFLTVILLPKRRVLGNGSAFFLPWLTTLVILIVTIACSIEGTICWIMLSPLFAIVAGVGGLIANRFRRKKIEINDKENYDYWTKPDKLSVSCLLLLPMITGTIEGERLLNREDMLITESIEIKASPSAVWKSLTNINDIKQGEKHASFASWMGFPSHTSTTLDTLAVGGKRIATYEKGLHFDETITEYKQEKRIVLDIKTDPNKIPPTVMDEHILIGGKHVDILQDVYTLEPLSNGNCVLKLSSHFFINTPFNWYAAIWAKYLMSDILSAELELIQSRAVK
jgi:hypothetical protein